ncbi:hypothetical protein ALC57_12245, partial [Trachymyrmex cornetzi]
ASARRSRAAKVLEMTRTRRNYTVCLPKRRICLEYESAAAPLRDKGDLSFSVRIISTIVILFDRCCNPLVIRDSSKSIGPRVDSRISKGRRRGGAKRRTTGRRWTDELYISSVAHIPSMSDAPTRAFLRRKKSRSPQFTETDREIEIFIPAVEKRSAIDAITRLSALFLPVAHAVVRAIFLLLSPSRSHSIFSAHSLPALYPLPSIFFFSHWHGWRYVCLPIPHPS